MVIEFLKKMKKYYDDQCAEYENSLKKLNTELIENEKFKSMLEAESQKVFRDFTPRELDNKNRSKIQELNNKLLELTNKRDEIQHSLSEITSTKNEIDEALKEVRELEMAAEDSRWFEENVYDAGDDKEEPTRNKLSDEVASKLETILSFLLSDPIRAKRELESLIKNGR